MVFASDLQVSFVHLDQMSFDQMSFDQMSFDQMSFDQMSFDLMFLTKRRKTIGVSIIS